MLARIRKSSVRDQVLAALRDPSFSFEDETTTAPSDIDAEGRIEASRIAAPHIGRPLLAYGSESEEENERGSLVSSLDILATVVTTDGDCRHLPSDLKLLSIYSRPDMGGQTLDNRITQYFGRAAHPPLGLSKVRPARVG